MKMNILNVVHGGDGSLSIGLLLITNETETTAPASVAVFDDNLQRQLVISMSISRDRDEIGDTYGLLNLSKVLKLLTQGILISVPGQAATTACQLASSISMDD
jgi:hypothetical protein